MSRLTDKLRQAAGAAARIQGRIESRADDIIARETKLSGRTDEVFASHDAHLDEAEKGLDEAERALAVMSNEPPVRPTSGSGASGA